MDKTLLQQFNFEENVSLKQYNTFRIGGNAKYLLKPKSVDEFVQIIRLLEKYSENYHIIGRGSNILFADVMKTEYIIITSDINHMTVNKNIVMADCGISLREFCYLCLKQNLSGMEGLSGIPGTIGGAVYMNAGAYGYSTDQILESVEVYDKKNNEQLTFSNQQCHFTYRNSIFMNSDHIILKGIFKMQQKKSSEEIKSLMKGFEKRRADKQPLNFPSAGSVFKKPYDTFHPAKEIQDLGLKGFQVGDACISEKHSGFIINKNTATAEDILQLIDIVREKIYQKTGVCLKTEIKYLI